MEPKVSVIIPTYNRADLVTNAIESVLAQRKPAHEIIVVDDGSTDHTAAVVRAYVNEAPDNSPVVRYIYQENQRQSAALNNGLAHATGDWVAVLASDDLWKPEKLEWQLRAIEKYKDTCGACFTDAQYINHPDVKATAFQRAGKNYSQSIGMNSDTARSVASGSHGILVQTLIVRADLMQNVGGFDVNLFLHEDTDFVFRLALLTDFCYVNYALVDVDRTPNRAVGMIELLEKDNLRLQQRQFMYEKWLRLAAQHNESLSKLVGRRLSSIHSEWANCYLAASEYRNARESLKMAVRYSPGAGIAGKFFMSCLSPGLLAKIMRARASRGARRMSSNNW